MASGLNRLEDCEMKIEHLSDDQWRVEFLHEGNVEYANILTIENGDIVTFHLGGKGGMRVGNNQKLIPVNRIKEEEQEQRILHEIKANNSVN